jgi:DNA-binding transcriptional ArsR family regulator
MADGRPEVPQPRIEWDSGTAYDFFASFYVLHSPDDFGLRASWAAGVRSRLSEETRRFMADALHFVGVPAEWIHELPAPRDSRAAVQALERTPPETTAEVLAIRGFEDPKLRELHRRIVLEGRWTAADVEDVYRRTTGKASAKLDAAERARTERWLEAISRPAEFGKSFLLGMEEFRESFFREEEKRIAPALDGALRDAQRLSASRTAVDLLEELTQGLRLGHLLDRACLLLVPCYWCSPRIIHGALGEGCRVILFGARPADASLVPGDEVPASLILALNALSDTTRLNILRLLRDESLTQAEIARRLRLRASTISHHLKSLRIAGLITYLEPEGGELRYQTRVPHVQEVCAGLRSFLKA